MMKDHEKQESEKEDTSPDSPDALAANAHSEAASRLAAAQEGARPAAELALPRARRIVKLGDLGARLPVGLTTDGVIATRLGTRRWRTAEERQMGKLKKPNASIVEHVGLVIACMCSEFGGWTWTDMPKNADEFSRRRVAINQALMGDVFYAYAYLRRETMGAVVNMRVVCPNCGKEQRVPADLDTLEVVTVDDPKALAYHYDLQRPVAMRGKEVKRINMTCPRWYAMETAVENGADDSEVKAAMLRSSIVGFNDDPAPIQTVDSDIDELYKVDLEGVLSVMDVNTVGPNMMMEGTCGKCRREYKQSISWRYDDFFGRSSR
jgi:hypothetical protein